MLNSSLVNVTVKALVKEMNNGTVSFDNIVQRGLAWEEDPAKGKDQKSLLVHSVIYGYFIPMFIAVSKDGYKDMLDGKQRSNALKEFRNNDFKLNLINVTEDEKIVEYTNENGETESCELDGKFYKDLPEEIRERFDDRTLYIELFDETMSDDEANTQFFRSNNGKALKAAERSWAMTRSVNIIDDIGQNILFEKMLTPKARESKIERTIIMKAWATLTMDEPVWEDKFLAPILKVQEITDEEAVKLNNVFTRIMEIHDLIENKRVAKRMYARTHVASMVKVIADSIEKGFKPEYVADFISYFYNGGKTTTISSEYNKSCSSGSNRKSSVCKRVEILDEEYNKFFDNYDFAAKDKEIKEKEAEKLRLEEEKRMKEEAKKIEAEEKEKRKAEREAKKLAKALADKEKAEAKIAEADADRLAEAERIRLENEKKNEELSKMIEEKEEELQKSRDGIAAIKEIEEAYASGELVDDAEEDVEDSEEEVEAIGA